jgi:hypothetical protein
MGFSLSSIVSDITSLATDPGKLAKDVCDAVLPQNMKAIGDIVGGAVDYETGHPLQALGHLTDALKDLPQMAQGLSPGKTNAGSPAGSPAAEPAPPTPRAPVAQAAATSVTVSLGPPPPSSTPAAQTTVTNGASSGASPPSSTSVAQSATPGVTVSTGASPAASAPTSGRTGTQITISVDPNGGGVTISERSAPRPTGATYRAPTSGATYRAPTVPGHHHEATGRNTVTVATASSTPAAAAAAPATGGGPSTATAAPAATGGAGASAGTAPSGSSSSTSSASATAASASGASASTSGSEGAGSAAVPSSLSDLMALSPDQFMQAVTSGKIPPDVANNPGAMTQIQARMDQITQMNQLVTSMMAAMHQMQMAVIQNIRV